MKRSTKWLAALAVTLLALSAGLLLKGFTPRVPSGTWASGGTLADARSGASAVLLEDGRILVTGGTGAGGPLASAEPYRGDGFSSRAASMYLARSRHTSVVLPDGRVLVAGGEALGEGPTNAAEIYDPVSGSWRLAGAMAEARAGHTATLLSDGRVLIAGGESAAGVRSSLEIFDPNRESFSYAGVMASPRKDHAAALLSDGRVLIVGGSNGNQTLGSTTVYDPSSGSVSAGPALAGPRMGHSATALLNGDILVVGGNDGAQELASAEIYNAAAGSFSAAPSSLNVARSGHLAFLLPHNNSVLIVGGSAAGAALASAELYLPWAGRFEFTGSLSEARAGAAGSPMAQDGLLLVAGGSQLASTELYGFATVKTDKDDYSPGETVIITGSGWQPGETVSLLLQEDADPPFHPDRTLTAVADANGDIFNDEFRPEEHDVGVRFYLTASGLSSGLTAQTTFTDARNWNLNFAGTGSGSVTITPSTGTVNAPSSCGGTNAAAASQTVTSTCSPHISTSVNDAVVTFDASAASGSVFAGWSGATSLTSNTCSGTTNPCSAVIGSNAELTVTFNTASAGPTKLAFTTSPFTVVVGQCSPTTTVQSQDASSTPTNVTSDTTVSLSSSSGSGEFFANADSTCSGSTLSSVVISSGTDSASFRYKDGAAGSPQLTASATGLTSAQQTETVNKAATSTSVSSSANPSVFGQSVSFTATVSATAPGSGTPAGSVQFKIDGSNFGSPVALSGGSATNSATSSLTVGNHTVEAVYSETANYLGSTGSLAGGQDVNKADTTLTIDSDSPDPSVVGETYTVTWSVTVDSPGSGTPTGTVTISGGSGCSAAVEAGQCDVTSTAAGAKTLTADYSGDDNFNGDSVTESHQVDKADTSTSVSSSANPSVFGQSVTFTATVVVDSPGSGTPTGNVEFFDGVDSLGTGALSGSAPFEATLATSALSVSGSPHSITAKYLGDSDFNDSTSDPLSQVVNKADTTTSITSDSPDPSVVGQAYSVSGTVTVDSPGDGTPTGTVDVTGGSSCSATVADDGTWSCELTSTTAGAKTLTATYSGDDNFSTSSDTESHQVDKADTSTSITSSANPSVFGQSVTFTAAVTIDSPGDGTPTGNVEFFDGASSLGTGALSGSAPFEATLATSALSVSGSPHSITAKYLGDSNFNDSTSDPLSQVVDKADTSVSLVSNNNPSEFGESVTFTATVSVEAPGAGSPTGSVTFYAGASCSGTVLAGPTALNGSFQAAFSTSALTAADSPHTITACYGGDGNFNASDGSLSQTVDPAQVTETVSVTPSTQQYSDLVTFVATLSPTSINGLAPATSVTFYVGTQNVGSATLAVDGGVLKGTLSNVPLLEPVPFGTAPTGQMAPGAHTVKAVFGGVDPNFDVDDATTSLTINQEDAAAEYTGTTFAWTRSPSDGSFTVTLSATIFDITAVPASSDGNPGDIRNATVTFVDRGTNATLCAATVAVINPSDPKVGTAVCNWIGSLSSEGDTFNVGVVVNGYYTRNSGSDDASLNIARPLNTNFITGGGYLVNSSSVGMIAGLAGKKTNFGFNVKYNKSGKNLQGNVNMIVRAACLPGGTPGPNGYCVYQIKSNAINSLGVNVGPPGTAQFSSKANLKDVTNPAYPVAIAGNLTLQLNMTDSGEPGNFDSLGIQVTGGSTLWFSSNWGGNATIQQVLGGGNLVVH